MVGREKSEQIKQVGSAVRQLRQLKDLSIQELAEQAGLSITFLSDVERGKKIPSLITLDKIAVALKSSLHRLIPNIDPSVERIGREEFLDSLRPHLKQSYAPTEASYLLVCMRSLSENFPQSDC